MPLAIFQQIVARPLLWIILISMDVVGPLIFLLKPQGQWIYIARLILSLISFAYLWLLEEDALITDMREIFLYDVMINCIATGLYVSGLPAMKFHWGFSATVFFLKYARLVWPFKVTDGKKLSAWPVFGVLTFFARHANSSKQDSAPTQTQAQWAYSLIIACSILGVAVGIGGIEIKLAYFCFLPLLVAPLLYKRTQAEIFALHERYLSAEKAKADAEKAIVKAEAKAEAERYITAEKEKSNKLLAIKNDELAAKNAELESMNGELALAKAKEEQMSLALLDAAHDLKTPIALLTFAVNDIVKATTPEQREVALQAFHASRMKVSEAITHTLLYAQVVTNVVKPTIEAIDLGALIRSIRNQWREPAFEKGVEVIKTYPRGRDRPMVAGDYVMITRIVQNLLVNAVTHAAPTDRILMSLRVRGDTCLFQVWDVGVGIADADGPDGEENFIRFANRVLRDKHLNGQGHGLGINIVRKLCEVSQFPIALHSRIGHGTVFSIVMPFASPKMVTRTLRRKAVSEKKRARALANLRQNNTPAS